MKPLRVVSAVVAVMSLCLSLRVASAQDAATAYQIDPAHDGQIVTPNFHFPLRTRWTVDLTGTGINGWNGTPLIAEGKVFSRADDKLYALDIKTGSILWGPVTASSNGDLAYDNGRLFFVPLYGNGFTNGEMYAYDAGTGQLLWSTPLPGQYSFGATPTALGGIVYIGGSGTGGTLYAVRETDGALLWTAKIENGDDCSPAVTPDGVYCNQACPKIYKFDPITGAPLWYYGDNGCSGGGGSTPVYYAGYLYARSLTLDANWGGVILDAQTGKAMGNFDPGYHDAAFPPAFYGNLGYYVQGGPYLFRSSLTAIDVRTNQTVWTVDASSDLIYAAPLVVNGVVYTVTHNGLLNGYEALSGNLVSSTQLTIDPTGGTPQTIAISGMNAAQGVIVVGAGAKLTAVAGSAPPYQLVLGSSAATGSVTVAGGVILASPAPAGGVTVTLRNTNPHASAPASVFIPAGKRGGPITVTTTATGALSPGLIAGTLNGDTESVALMVTPPSIDGFKLVPATVQGGKTVQAIIHLSGPAPAGGTVVTLASGAPATATPTTKTITIPAGRQYGLAYVSTAAVTASTTVTITASAYTGVQKAALMVTP